MSTLTETEYYAGLIEGHYAASSVKRRAANASIEGAVNAFANINQENLGVEQGSSQWIISLGMFGSPTRRAFALTIGDDDKPTIYSLVIEPGGQMRPGAQHSLDLIFFRGEWFSTEWYSLTEALPGEPRAHRTAAAAILKAIFESLSG